MKRKVESGKCPFCQKYSSSKKQGRLFPLMRCLFLVRKEGFLERKLLDVEVMHFLLFSPVLLVSTLRFMTAYVTPSQAVMRHMHEMGLAAVYPGPNLSKRAHQAAIYPYLLTNVTASYPNHICGLDITYIRLRQGWLYLVAILDWYSRYVLSWELDQTMQVAFVLEAMRRALRQARPAICNSDQGSQFTSMPYLELLKKHEVRISMDGRGRALDNIFTERLWRTIKYEEVYLRDYSSPREARQSLTEYLQFYNERRIHQALDYRTPAELYFK